MNDWHVAERWERERAQEAERRRADAEMSRNFGQEVGASTRGRGSHSPWRASTHTTAPSPTATTGTPMSLQSTATAGSLGFRPLTGPNRLSGANSVGLSMAAGTSDGRRGYGMSAPSTQFHYQPSSSRPAANSYPVSRDEDEEEKNTRKNTE